MGNLTLPDSSSCIGAVRAGRDPFRDFAAGIDAHDCEFATCGGSCSKCVTASATPTSSRYRERFAVMIFIPPTLQIWQRAEHLAWSLDRQGRVLPAQDLPVAAYALHADAPVLTADADVHSIPGLRVIDRLQRGGP